jgi:hypothetical protein
MEDVVAKVEEAKSPITVSGIPIYAARKTCLANCEIAGVDYLLYETATGWEIVSINEDESFTSVLTGTGVMHDMCNHLDSIILAGEDGAWIVEDGALEIIYDSEVTSIQSDGSSLWGVVGGKVCQFGGTDGFLTVYTDAVYPYEYRQGFLYNGDYYSLGNISGTFDNMYKLVSGSWSLVYTEPSGYILSNPVVLNGVLYVVINNSFIYSYNGTGFDLVYSASGTITFMRPFGDKLAFSAANNGKQVYLLDATLGTAELYATVDKNLTIDSCVEYNDFLIVTTFGATWPVYVYSLASETGETVQQPCIEIEEQVGDSPPQQIYVYNNTIRMISLNYEYIISAQVDSYSVESITANTTVAYIMNDENRFVITDEFSSPEEMHIRVTYPYGTPTPIDDTVRAYSKLRLLADALYCGATDGEVYKVETAGLTQITSTLSGCYALAWRKNKVYAAGATQVYLVNANGTISEVENATSATTIKELFVSGDYLVWCPTYASPATGTLYAAFVEYTGSVNVYQDITLHVPADFPIGATKTFRKMSAYSGTPVKIDPPTGATFEGKTSISLYGQYSFVVLERISATVFAIREWNDYVTNSNGKWTRSSDGTERWTHKLSITPVANTPTLGTWTLPVNSGTIPFVVDATMRTTAPYVVSRGVSALNYTATTVDVYFTRTDTTATGIALIAIGYWK